MPPHYIVTLHQLTLSCEVKVPLRSHAMSAMSLWREEQTRGKASSHHGTVAKVTTLSPCSAPSHVFLYNIHFRKVLRSLACMPSSSSESPDSQNSDVLHLYDGDILYAGENGERQIVRLLDLSY